MLVLKLEALAGDSIKNTVHEMHEVSKRLGLAIQVKFNDVTLYMPVNGDPFKLEEEFYEKLKRTDIKHKFASG